MQADLRAGRNTSDDEKLRVLASSILSAAARGGGSYVKIHQLQQVHPRRQSASACTCGWDRHRTCPHAEAAATTAMQQSCNNPSSAMTQERHLPCNIHATAHSAMLMQHTPLPAVIQHELLDLYTCAGQVPELVWRQVRLLWGATAECLSLPCLRARP